MSQPTTHDWKPARNSKNQGMPAEDNPEKDTIIKDAVASRGESDDGQEDELAPHLHTKTFLAVFSVCLIYFAQDFALVGAGAQGQIISRHFGRPGDTVWITAPITIFTVVLGPIVSQAADYWGRKWFLVVLSLFGGIGCLIVACAISMNMIIAGSCIIGVGFGAQPLLHTVASEVLPRRWRAWAQSAVMVSNGLGLLVGLLAGGAFNRHGNPNGFRYHFYIAMAFFVLASVICIFVYQPRQTDLQMALSFKEKASQLDWVGYILLASSLVLFCMGLFWSQNPYAWSDAHPSAPFAVGLALASVLIFYEAKFKKDGMFHHGLFKVNWNFTISIICVFCEGMAFFAATIYFPFQVSVLYETDFLMVSVRFSIAYITTLAASLFTGLYCDMTKKVRWVTFTAFVIFVAFFICMATTNKDSSLSVWGYPVLMGWALGMTLVTLITAAQLSIRAELISIASGLIISVRSLGATIGIAIYNSVFISATQRLEGNVSKAIAAAGLPQTSIEKFVADLLAQNTSSLSQVFGVNQDIIQAGLGALKDTYSAGFRNVWCTAAAFTVLALVASVFLFDPSKEFNNHIDAPVEKEEDLFS
ncbi:MFS general substrate transporter-22 [Coleophoma cylindrospora]|uniref:MFS general substrate transporter-22 n=1 Tax=Coleophoma cylindrospora TaxID=1849047 RepID=A0A3D8S6E2_9HELO|nr:MFS general substrate transporter-22 [Coleophoma cylindrospora]